MLIHLLYNFAHFRVRKIFHRRSGNYGEKDELSTKGKIARKGKAFGSVRDLQFGKRSIRVWIAAQRRSSAVAAAPGV